MQTLKKRFNLQILVFQIEFQNIGVVSARQALLGPIKKTRVNLVHGTFICTPGYMNDCMSVCKNFSRGIRAKRGRGISLKMVSKRINFATCKCVSLKLFPEYQKA